MDYETFEAVAVRVVAEIDFPMIMEAHVKGRGVIPVGLACLRRVETHVEPELHWFWWASNRNKVEAVLKLLFKWAEDVPFVIPVLRGSKEHRMMTQMERYGVARRIGTSHNWVPDGPVAIFETRY